MLDVGDCPTTLVPVQPLVHMQAHPACAPQGMQYNPGARTIEGELEAAMVRAGAISKDNAGDFTKVACPASPAHVARMHLLARCAPG